MLLRTSKRRTSYIVTLDKSRRRNDQAPLVGAPSRREARRLDAPRIGNAEASVRAHAGERHPLYLSATRHLPLTARASSPANHQLGVRLARFDGVGHPLAKDTATHNKYRAAMAEAVQMRDEERMIAAPSVAAAVQTTAAATAPASLAQPPKPPPSPKTKPPPPPPRQRVLPGAPPRLDVAAAHPTTSATPALASPPGIQPQLNLQSGDFAHAAGHQHHHLSEPSDGATTASSGSAASQGGTTAA